MGLETDYIKEGVAEAMKDESPTLNRTIADCVQAQYRYLPDSADIDPRDFGRRGVMYPLQSAEIDVVSR